MKTYKSLFAAILIAWLALAASGCGPGYSNTSDPNLASGNKRTRLGKSHTVAASTIDNSQ